MIENRGFGKRKSLIIFESTPGSAHPDHIRELFLSNKCHSPKVGGHIAHAEDFGAQGRHQGSLPACQTEKERLKNN